MLGLIGKLLKLVFVGTVVGAVAGWFKNRSAKIADEPAPPTVVDLATPSSDPRDEAHQTVPLSGQPEIPIDDDSLELGEIEEPVAPEPDRLPTYAQLTPEATEGELQQDEKPVNWLQPVDGKCPETHQVKARFSTGRYHRPTDRGYDRITPDCCYVNAEDAESDGFSRARW